MITGKIYRNKPIELSDFTKTKTHKENNDHQLRKVFSNPHLLVNTNYSSFYPSHSNAHNEIISNYEQYSNHEIEKSMFHEPKIAGGEVLKSMGSAG